MRRLRFLGPTVSICALMLVSALPTSAADLTIAPDSGSQSDTYTIEGFGLPAGLALDINFVSPEGTVFSTAALNLVAIVDPNGSFIFQFVPTDVFSGESLGTWFAQVCTTGTDDCAQTTFTIRG